MSPPVIPDAVRRFLSAAERFAALATIDPDGSPRQTLTWFTLADDDSIWVNSRHGRRWPANLVRDGRAALAVVDTRDPYSWVGLTCVLDEVVDDVARAREDIVALAHRYHPEGPDPADLARFRSEPRVMFRLRVTGVHDHREE